MGDAKRRAASTGHDNRIEDVAQGKSGERYTRDKQEDVDSHWRTNGEVAASCRPP
jgi:hypothetical protein